MSNKQQAGAVLAPENINLQSILTPTFDLKDSGFTNVFNSFDKSNKSGFHLKDNVDIESDVNSSTKKESIEENPDDFTTLNEFIKSTESMLKSSGVEIISETQPFNFTDYADSILIGIREMKQHLKKVYEDLYELNTNEIENLNDFQFCEKIKTSLTTQSENKYYEMCLMEEIIVAFQELIKDLLEELTDPSASIPPITQEELINKIINEPIPNKEEIIKEIINEADPNDPLKVGGGDPDENERKIVRKQNRLKKIVGFLMALLSLTQANKEELVQCDDTRYDHDEIGSSSRNFDTCQYQKNFRMSFNIERTFFESIFKGSVTTELQEMFDTGISSWKASIQKDIQNQTFENGEHQFAKPIEYQGKDNTTRAIEGKQTDKNIPVDKNWKQKAIGSRQEQIPADLETISDRLFKIKFVTEEDQNLILLYGNVNLFALGHVLQGFLQFEENKIKSITNMSSSAQIDLKAKIQLLPSDKYISNDDVGQILEDCKGNKECEQRINSMRVVLRLDNIRQSLIDGIEDISSIPQAFQNVSHFGQTIIDIFKPPLTSEKVREEHTLATNSAWITMNNALFTFVAVAGLIGIGTIKSVIERSAKESYYYSFVPGVFPVVVAVGGSLYYYLAGTVLFTILKYFNLTYTPYYLNKIATAIGFYGCICYYSGTFTHIALWKKEHSGDNNGNDHSGDNNGNDQPKYKQEYKQVYKAEIIELLKSNPTRMDIWRGDPYNPLKEFKRSNLEIRNDKVYNEGKNTPLTSFSDYWNSNTTGGFKLSRKKRRKNCNSKIQGKKRYGTRKRRKNKQKTRRRKYK